MQIDSGPKTNAIFRFGPVACNMPIKTTKETYLKYKRIQLILKKLNYNQKNP